MRPERADFRPEKADLRSERADLRPERADLRPERTDFSPNQSPKSNMWSAIPFALLCMLVIVGNGLQGSGPEGDDVL